MEIKKNNVALLVHSCDRYELLYKGFEFFFSQHWDYNIDCNYYFATEEKEVTVNGFKNIHSGKGEWADRLKHLLQNCITEPYVLYFQEDMWINKRINPLFFNELFDLAVSNNWHQVKLHSSNVYVTKPSNIFIEGFNVAQIDNNESDYLMSHQVTLWNKEFLLKQLHKKEHPWRNERKGTKRLRKLNPDIFQIDYFAENGHVEINANNNQILRSEYNTVSVNGVLNHNIKSYIKELEKGSDVFKEYATKLDYNYKNNLTHDGKPKPRKEDVFKKMKNWFKKQ